MPVGRAREALRQPGCSRLPGSWRCWAGCSRIIMSAREDDAAQPAAVKTTAVTPVTKPVVKPPPAAVAIKVTGAGAYDPEGDRSENGGDARLATDGNAKTAWETEHYRSTFHKSGVGLVLDAGKPVRASRVVVTTDDSGLRGAGAGRQLRRRARSAPCRGRRRRRARTAFALKPRRARYLVIWITSMPPGGVAAAVNEVRVSARG